MLRIRVELVPGGDESRVREQARIELANISGLAHISDYRIMAWERDNRVSGIPEWESRGQILNHDRRQTVWSLVEKAAAWAQAEAEKNS